MPERIQRQRTRGWKMPPNTVYVGRPSKWGNPYRVGQPDPMLAGNVMTASDALRMYEWYLEANPVLQAEAIMLLHGKDLACWCKPGEPCHADVLLRLANNRVNPDRASLVRTGWLGNINGAIADPDTY